MNKCPHCHRIDCPCVDYAEVPCDCPEKIPTKRFTSPNSPLPPDELDVLQRCIEAANDLLRSLGNESNPDNTRQLQLHFLNLEGVCVKVKLKCEVKKKSGEDAVEKTGVVVTAGRDFIQINSLGNDVFILYERLISLSREDCPKHKHHEKEKVPRFKMYFWELKRFFQDWHKWFFLHSRVKLDIKKHHEHDEPEFLHADRTTRRKLVLNFGDFVAKDPELVNLFFGLSLHMHLKHYLGKDIKVKTDDHRMMEGTLFKVESERIKVKNRYKSKEFNMDELCFLEVKR
ncbi:hypothetical protein [Pradoshia sp.]